MEHEPHYVTIPELVDSLDEQSLLNLNDLIDWRLYNVAGSYPHYMITKLWRERFLAVPLVLATVLVTFGLTFIVLRLIPMLNSFNGPTLVAGLVNEELHTPAGLLITVHEPRTEPSLSDGYVNVIVKIEVENQGRDTVPKNFVLIDEWSNEYQSWDTIPVDGLSALPFFIERDQVVSGAEVFIVPEAALDGNLRLIWLVERYNERIDVQLSEPPFDPLREPFQELNREHSRSET